MLRESVSSFQGSEGNSPDLGQCRHRVVGVGGFLLGAVGEGAHSRCQDGGRGRAVSHLISFTVQQLWDLAVHTLPWALCQSCNNDHPL